MNRLLSFAVRTGALLLLLLSSFFAFAQTVRGRISDEAGKAVAGVSVTEKGTANATASVTDGSYSLTVKSPKAVLVFSFVGYVTKEVVASDARDVSLSPDETKKLEQVVVVGYGIQRRKDLTGSVASVGAKDIQKLPVAGVDQALQGQVPGLQINTTSGAPGGNTTILLRGVSSITGGIEPLIVIDGYPVSNTGFGNPLVTLNPADIESIDVLKDASSTAIYGSRGSNGVIIITTKRGKSGKPKIDLDVYTGVQSLAKKIEMMDSKAYAQFVIDGRNNGYLDNVPGAKITDDNNTRAGLSYDIPLSLQNPGAVTANTDWQDRLFTHAPISNYQVGVTGGADAVKYSFSGGYFDQEGIVRNTYLHRFSFKSNADAKVSEKLKVGIGLLPSYSEIKRMNTADHYAALGIIQAAQAYSPALPVYNPDGSYTYNQALEGQVDIQNPLRIADEYSSTVSQFRLLGNAFAEYEILKDLRLRVTGGADLNYYKNRLWTPSTLTGTPTSPGLANATAENEIGTNWLNENTIAYKRAFGRLHSIDFVGGITFQKAYVDNINAGAIGFPDNLVPNINGGTVNRGGEAINRETLVSFLSRINYTLNQKYLFTFTFRRDGSSRFGSKKRWGNFPSGAFAWRLSDENFVKGMKAVSDLKLRASYGLTGNNNIGNYRYIALLSSSNYVIGDVLTPGLTPVSFQNNNLGWESMTQFDAGLDLGLLANRVSLTADYYNRINKAMLFTIQTPAATGFTSATVNVGSVRNRGVELALTSRNFTGKAFTWTTNFNIAFNRNVVLSMSTEDEKIFGATGGRGNTNVTQKGSAIGSFYGRRALGVFMNDAEAARYTGLQPFAKAGDTRFKDVNGDGTINDNDREIIGSPLPKYTFGFNNSFSYKAFSLEIFTAGSVGQDIYNAQFAFNVSGVQNNAKYVDDRRWRSPDQPGDGTWPRSIRGSKNNNIQFSSLYIFDASYLRIRNVVLGYTLPATAAQKIKMQNLRLHAGVTNLYTFTNYPGYDPEVGNAGDDQRVFGVDFGTYPLARTITFGITAGF